MTAGETEQIGHRCNQSDRTGNDEAWNDAQIAGSQAQFCICISAQPELPNQKTKQEAS